MYIPQLYAFCGSLEVLFRGKSSKTFRHAALMGLKRTSLTLWALSFWVWFPPGDDAYFISCVLQLQALDKKHFLSACVISSIAKMDPGTKYTETKQGLYCTAQVCVCVHVFMCILSL